MEARNDRFTLRSDYDVVIVRQRARELARDVGFSPMDETRLATAVSEIARRALKVGGVIVFQVLWEGPRRGLSCICLLDGPLAEEQNLAVAAGRPGVSLEDVGRLVDDFGSQAQPDGTWAILMRRWLR